MSDNQPIHFSPPLIGEAEIARVRRVLESGWITTGPETAEFEKRFGDAVGSESALAVNSCTSALSLALRVLGIGEGDEVITSTNTFVSTVNVIEHTGATPRLVDIDPHTMNLDPERVAATINPKTKAIIAVHYAGHPADLDALSKIADDHGVELIEDAAHAVAAEYNGTPIGGTGNLTAFSFYATKNLSTGEGGMLTGPEELLQSARQLALHGMSRNAWNRYGGQGRWHYEIESAGFKCNMSDLQAAIGIAQLERLPEMQARRRQLFNRYSDAFSTDADFETPHTRSNIEHAHHLYVLRLRGSLTHARDDLFEGLYQAGVNASLHFIPIHLHKFYRTKYGYAPDDFPVAYDCFQRMLSLPLSPALSDSEVDRVIEVVRDTARRVSRRAA